jgi:hypothetical protein
MASANIKPAPCVESGFDASQRHQALRLLRRSDQCAGVSISRIIPPEEWLFTF